MKKNKFHLISQQPDSDKIYLNAIDLYEKILIFKENTGLKHFNDSKAYIEQNTRIIQIIFIKALKNRIQIKNAKFYLFLII